MLGASQSLDHRGRRNGHPYPADETIVGAYLALLRGGLGRQRGEAATRQARGRAAAHPKTRAAGRVRRPLPRKSARR
jgi:hypothetical protein